MNIRIGIIGFGKIGKIRFQNLLDIEGVLVQGVLDISEDISLPDGVIAYKTLEEMLLEVDAVIVSTFNDKLAEFCIKSLQAGKHVFCEKPPARSTKELLNVKNTLESCNDLVLKYGFNHRYHFSVMEAKNSILNEDWGKLIFCRGIYGKAGSIDYKDNWRNYKKISGGGILIDQGIHMLDLMRFLSDTDLILKHATVANLHWDIECEDNVFALFKNSQDAIFSLHSSATQWKHKFLLELIFENGYLILDGILSQTMSYAPEKLIKARKNKDANLAMGSLPEQVMIFDKDESWKRELIDFIDCIKHKKEVKNGSIDDAMNVLSLIEKIYNKK